jgi:hypothetical protein
MGIRSDPKAVTGSQIQQVSLGNGWQTICNSFTCKQPLFMFRITHKSVSQFSLGEILLMASLNQLENKRKVAPNE